VVGFLAETGVTKEVGAKAAEAVEKVVIWVVVQVA